jgi:hypothetical protein
LVSARCPQATRGRWRSNPIQLRYPKMLRVKRSDRVIGKAIDPYRGAVRTNL